MKHNYFIAIALLLCNFAHADLTTGLVAYYPFNGNANDASGNGNNGMVYGATLTVDRFGNENSAYSFNGVDNYLKIDTSSDFDIGIESSYAVWVNPIRLPVGNRATIINKWINGNEDKRLMLMTDGSIDFYMFNCMSGNVLLSISKIPLNQWTYIVGTYGGNSAKIYLNGVLDTSVQTSSQCNVGDNLGSLYIANHPERIYEGKQPLNGSVDDIRIYNRALSAAEIQELYLKNTTHQLTITKDGAGNGTITSNPAGIDCGSTCSANFAHNSSVTLTATPYINSVFDGFFGFANNADCNDSHLTMNINKKCYAEFSTHIPIHTCGVLIAGVEFGCVLLNGYLIENSGNCLVGDQVCVDGYISQGCISYCMQGNGCIIDNSISCTRTPTAITDAAININVNSAQLNGTVTSANATAAVSFDFGTTNAYGSNITATPAQVYSNTPVAVSAVKTGLSCGTEYHYRAKAVNSIGTGFGADQSFTTATCPQAVNAWLNPPTLTKIRDQVFTLDVIANSNSVKLGSYMFVVTLDTTKLVLDTSYQNISGTCSKGVCPGSNAVANRATIVNAAGNTITLTGDSTGVGPGNDLQLLVMHLKTKLTTGATPVTLTTSALDATSGETIGLGAIGAIINISPGICGDCDGNGVVNIVDALAMARKVVGLPPPPTVDTTLCDVNKNGHVDINDALMIARYCVGLVLPPEVCAIGQPL